MTIYEVLLGHYYKPKLAELTEKVGREGFGWTPCEHYQNCIGWCPRCLDLKQKVNQMNVLWPAEVPNGQEGG